MHRCEFCDAWAEWQLVHPAEKVYACDAHRMDGRHQLLTAHPRAAIDERHHPYWISEEEQSV